MGSARQDVAKVRPVCKIRSRGYPPGEPRSHARRREIVVAAARNRIPDFYTFREGTDDGGLISYGVNIPALYRRASRFVDRIFEGRKTERLTCRTTCKI